MATNKHQKQQREATIASALEAAASLQEKGVTLTFRAIAEEAELSISTILQAEIKNALYSHYAIGRKKKDTPESVEKLQEELAKVKQELKHSQEVNRQLRNTIKAKTEESKSWELKYRQILYRYAIEIDKRIMPL